MLKTRVARETFLETPEVMVVGGQYEVFDLGLHAVNKVLSRTGFVKPSYPLR